MRKILLLAVPLVLAAGAEAAEHAGSPFCVLGAFAFEEGNFAHAEALLREGAARAPEDSACRRYLGETYLRRGRPSEAEPELRAASVLEAEERALGGGDAPRPDAADEESLRRAAEHLLEARYGEALAALDRAFGEAARSRADYYRGLGLAKLGRTEEARRSLEAARARAGSEALRENVRDALARMQAAQPERPRYALSAKLGAGYDSNVRLEPDDLDVAGDSFVVALASGAYDLLRPRRSVRLGVGYTHYQTWYRDLRDFDLLGSIGSVYAAYGSPRGSLRLGYAPALFRVGSELFLSRQEGNAVWASRLGSAAVATVGYAYQADRWPMDGGADGHIHVASVDLRRLFGKESFVSGGFGYRVRSAVDEEEGYREASATATFAAALGARWTVAGAARYALRVHREVEPGRSAARRDRNGEASLALSKALGGGFAACAEHRLSVNDSEFSEFDYRRSVTAFSVSWVR